jgi:hypothetical protein
MAWFILHQKQIMRIQFYRKTKDQIVWFVIEAAMQCGFEVFHLNKEEGLILAVKHLKKNYSLIVNTLLTDEADHIKLTMTTTVFSASQTFIAIAPEARMIVNRIRALAVADNADEIQEKQSQALKKEVNINSL